MKVTVIPVVIGTLGTVTKGLVQGLEDLEIRGCVETIQATVPKLLRLVRKLKRVLCYILTLDRAVNQRCTSVNKRKEKRKQVGVMKEYRQMPAAVELVGKGRPEWEPACRLRTALSDLRLSNPSQDAEEVLSDFLKIIQRAMLKRRSWVNIAVCPSRHSSLTHHKNINPFENKVWEVHKEVWEVHKEVFVHSLNGVNSGYTTPGDFRRLVVTQTLVKDHLLILIWKTLKE